MKSSARAPRGPGGALAWPYAGLDVYVMNADGNDVTRLTHHRDNDFESRWAPDGKLIAFTTERHRDERQRRIGGGLAVYVMKPDGSDLTYVTEGTAISWSICKTQR